MMFCCLSDAIVNVVVVELLHYVADWRSVGASLCRMVCRQIAVSLIAVTYAVFQSHFNYGAI